MKLILSESDNLSEKQTDVLVYRGKNARVYTDSESKVICVVGEGYVNRFNKADIDCYSSLHSAFHRTHSSEEELKECMKILNIKESAFVDETESAKKVKRWVFNIQCLDYNDIDKSINYDLSDVPEQVRQQLAKDIVRYPMNRIYEYNNDAIEGDEE